MKFDTKIEAGFEPFRMTEVSNWVCSWWRQLELPERFLFGVRVLCYQIAKMLGSEWTLRVDVEKAQICQIKRQATTKQYNAV